MQLPPIPLFSLLTAILSTQASEVGPKTYEHVLLSKKEHVEFTKELTIHGIIPEVVPLAPPRIVYLGYVNGNYSLWPGTRVASGLVGPWGKGQWGPSEIAEAPFNCSWGANSTDQYTLVLFDFDAPLRITPVLREYIHWMVGNIPGTGVMMGEEYFGYFPPKARSDTGIHRYVLLVWRQKNYVEFKEPKRNETDEADRAYFNHTAFALKYDLGSPIALTYFECEWDYTQTTPHED